jgi:hypothetical protein
MTGTEGNSETLNFCLDEAQAAQALLLNWVRTRTSTYGFYWRFWVKITKYKNSINIGYNTF